MRALAIASVEINITAGAFLAAASNGAVYLNIAINKP